MIRVGNYELSYASDLKEFGHTSDGHPFIGETYYVIATDDAGNRWILKQRFDGVKVTTDEQGEKYFEDTRAWAGAACRTMIMRAKARGYINLAHWSQDRPVYGSEAYIAYGQADDVAWERASEDL